MAHPPPLSTPSLRGLRAAFVASLFAAPLAATPQVWVDQFGTNAQDSLRAIEDDGAGGVFVAGVTAGSLVGPNLGALDVFVQRRDLNGNVLWAKQFGTANYDSVVDIASDGAGGLFLAGGIPGDQSLPIPDPFDAVVTRLDAAGNVTWSLQFGTSEYDAATAVCSDGSGGAFVAGISGGAPDSLSSTLIDAWLARISPAGQLLWQQSLASPQEDQVRGIVAVPSGGVYLVGDSEGSLFGPSLGGRDLWYGRFAADGSVILAKQLGTALDDFGGEVALAGNGDVFLSGWTGGDLAAPTGPDTDAFVLRQDSAGNTLWARQFGSAGNESLVELALDGAGGVFVVGGVADVFGGPGSDSGDAFLTQLDASGVSVGTLQFGGEGYDLAHGALADGAGGLIAVGLTEYGLLATQVNIKFDAWVARFGPCDFDVPVAYCVGAPNSTGQGASISSDGNRYVTNNDFALGVSGCPIGQVGIFVMGTAQASSPFGDGTLCVGGNVSRLLPAQVTDANGAAALQLDLTDPSSPASMIAPGSTWNFQFWYRDTAGGGAGFNLSNGLSVAFCP